MHYSVRPLFVPRAWPDSLRRFVDPAHTALLPAVDVRVTWAAVCVRDCSGLAELADNERQSTGTRYSRCRESVDIEAGVPSHFARVPGRTVDGVMCAHTVCDSSLL